MSDPHQDALTQIARSKRSSIRFPGRKYDEELPNYAAIVPALLAIAQAPKEVAVEISV